MAAAHDTPSQSSWDNMKREEETIEDSMHVNEVQVEIEEDEDDDIIAVKRPSAALDQGRPAVDFSVVLSSTYRVPVLWFSFPSIPRFKLDDLEKVYALVATPNTRGALLNTGVMGGISIANHPITDRPAFFIHPCNTPDALKAVSDDPDLKPVEYLLLWLGIVGSAVGMHLPLKLASHILLDGCKHKRS